MVLLKYGLNACTYECVRIIMKKKILFLPIHMRFHNFALEGIINCFKKIFGIHRIQIGKFLNFLFKFYLTDV